MDPWRERYSQKQICAFVTLSTVFLAPDEGTEKKRAEGTVLCVHGFVFLGVCCLFEIGAGLSSVNMPPWVIACSSKRGALTVFKCGLARFGRHFGSARHGNADPSPARGTSVHGVDSEWSGVCAWFCVCWSVLPVSDWCRAVQCQHATLGDRL